MRRGVGPRVTISPATEGAPHGDRIISQSSSVYSVYTNEHLTYDETVSLLTLMQPQCISAAGAASLTAEGSLRAQAVLYHNLQVMFQHIHLVKGGGRGTGVAGGAGMASPGPVGAPGRHVPQRIIA